MFMTMTSAPRLSFRPKRTRSITATQAQDELDSSLRKGDAKHVAIEWGAIDAPSSYVSKAKPQQDTDTSVYSESTASTLGDSISSLGSLNASAAKNTSSDNVEVIKVVRFCSVEIREYARALGDNPSVSSGPPITLRWEHSSVSTMDLENYESTRSSRRVKSQMAIPHMTRDDWLREAGYSRSEIADASRAAYEMKVQRRKSASQNKAGRKAKEITKSLGRIRRRYSN
uniref:Uncharacterized protein n=1 Tax=Odontella aurita TaxID=265563 RepID=A0A7S4MMC9_9STRA|mmetsp:Transcript_2565/g.6677  ORF Transcript_2565/g.6677 Transcript_2565/m.6677 type:complete len:228 (+) Transcript_2565:161-844(+)